jgi:hypothetical protein
VIEGRINRRGYNRRRGKKEERKGERKEKGSGRWGKKEKCEGCVREKGSYMGESARRGSESENG